MRIAELIDRFGGVLEGDGAVEVTGVSGVEFVGSNDATFATDDKLLSQAEASPACCVIVAQDARGSTKPLIRCSSPDSYVADLLDFFNPTPQPSPGVHPSAWIDQSAVIDESATIDANVTVGADCRIGPRVHLMASVVVQDHCVIGQDTVIHPNTTIYPRSRIGSGVLIHAGVVIGADGFGFFVEGDRLRKWPHVGNVIIEDDVEIGANTCVDRGKYGSTLIQTGAKIDNLVQVAHNCRIGRGAILAGQTGLSGSVVLEDGVICGGQAGVIDHVTVGRGARLAAKTGVIADVPPGTTMLGYPAKPHRRKLEELGVLSFLTDNRSAVRKLLKRAAEE